MDVSAAEPLRTVEATRVLPVFAVVAVIAAIVAGFDMLLVRMARQHETETGVRLFERGITARNEKKPAEALELFRAAAIHSPAKPDYQLAFAQALSARGLERESRASLSDLLSRSPAYGAANAEMARKLAKDGQWQQAAWFYHRALYGEWTGSPDLRSVRFELADLLADHGARDQLLSEVMLLDTNQNRSEDTRHLGRLLLVAGEWTRAERVYRTLLRASPEDSGLLAGLARAQFGTGRYLAAERGLRRAIDAGASGPALQRELETAESINRLDPSVRGLKSTEKHRRAHQLTSALVFALRTCSPESSAVADAEKKLARREKPRDLLASAETDLDLFERLWNSRRDICAASGQIPQEIELLAAQLTK